MKNGLKFLGPYIKAEISKFLIAFVSLMLSLYAFALIPDLLKEILNFMTDGTKGKIVSVLGEGNILLKGGIVCISFAIVYSFCLYKSGLYLAKGAESVIALIRCDLYRHLLFVKADWMDKQNSGDLISRTTIDIDVIRKFITSELLKVLKISLQCIVSAVFLWRINVKISIVAFIFIPILLIGSYIYFKKVSKFFRMADEKEAVLIGRAEENIENVKAYRAYGLEEGEVEKFKNENKEYVDLWIRLGEIHSYYFAGSNLLTGIEILLVLVVGCIEASYGRMSIGDYMAIFAYNTTLILPVKDLGRTLAKMGQAAVSIERINYILKSPKEEFLTEGLEPDLDKDIEFKNVYFSYDGKEDVLKDVSFKVPGGKMTAFLGETGSGKSTIFYLLMRFYSPDKGEISIGGVPIEKISIKYLRENIGIVLQTPYLYGATIKENLYMAKKEADFKMIKEVCQRASVHDNILEMADGYDTLVGEKGSTLSGGQKQRVAIAQILLKKPKIILFDDALSAVDADTDQRIRESLAEENKSDTILIITHRVKQSINADFVVLINEGRVSCFGEPKKLIKENKEYKTLVKKGMEDL